VHLMSCAIQIFNCQPPMILLNTGHICDF